MSNLAKRDTRARELDELVSSFRRQLAEAAVMWWKLGKTIARIHDRGLYLARYLTWHEFVEAELAIGKWQAHSLMRVAREYPEERALRIGQTKCVILMKLLPEDRPAVEERVLSGEVVTDAKLQKEVVRINAKRPTPANAHPEQRYVRADIGVPKVIALKALAAERRLTVEQLAAEVLLAFVARRSP